MQAHHLLLPVCLTMKDPQIHLLCQQLPHYHCHGGWGLNASPPEGLNNPFDPVVDQRPLS